ncbi:uncharacterized protein LOC105848937 isoform X2 [Hydra vulgaris]|uniref:uncharacterized protein LOC105848937 isoform X2 n=1 Tax=Hydra vulgaris TaxID=6087 RepID=UPI001F5FDFF8|nr:uncharacterized protein LOC105848937 isoform X2 [Hydra vulgaris]
MSSSEEEQTGSCRSRAKKERHLKSSKSKKSGEKMLEKLIAQQTEILEQQREMLRRVAQLEEKAATITNDRVEASASTTAALTTNASTTAAPTTSASTSAASITNDTSYEAYRVYRRRHRGPTSYSSYRKWADNGGENDASFNWRGNRWGRGRGGWGGNKNFNFIYK